MNTLPTEPLPHPALTDGAQALMGVSWLFTGLAIQAVALRFFVRHKIAKSFALDDWVMLLALVFHLYFQAFLTVSCVSGLGRSMTSMTVQEIIDMTKWSWLTTPGSILAGVAARVSIAMVLVHIFGMRTWFKWLIISFTSLVTLLGLVNFVFVWIQARPIEALWDFRVVADYRMTQMPQKVMTGVLMVLFAISDFTFALFPVIFIWKLNMARHKKIGLIFIMAGSVITMAAAIGRVVLVFMSTDSNTNVDDGSKTVFVFFGVGSLMASVEQSLVIILGSIPKLKVITQISFPKASAFNSSLNSLINRLRYGSQSRSAASNSSLYWTNSDVELSRAAKQELSGHPGGNCDPTVRGGDASSDASLEDHRGIRVTEGYSVTFNGSSEPKLYV